MARLITGEYRAYFYDPYGMRIKQARQVYAPCFTQAVKKARRYMKLCGYASFSINRAVYNSLDQHKFV